MPIFDRSKCIPWFFQTLTDTFQWETRLNSHPYLGPILTLVMKLGLILTLGNKIILVSPASTHFSVNLMAPFDCSQKIWLECHNIYHLLLFISPSTIINTITSYCTMPNIHDNQHGFSHTRFYHPAQTSIAYPWRVILISAVYLMYV